MKKQIGTNWVWTLPSPVHRAGARLLRLATGASLAMLAAGCTGLVPGLPV